jgi:hypothetical protein
VTWDLYQRLWALLGNAAWAPDAACFSDIRAAGSVNALTLRAAGLFPQAAVVVSQSPAQKQRERDELGQEQCAHHEEDEKATHRTRREQVHSASTVLAKR